MQSKGEQNTDKKRALLLFYLILTFTIYNVVVLYFILFHIAFNGLLEVLSLSGRDLINVLSLLYRCKQNTK